ncbi:hypothetical protein O3P69_011604 [Scylla paramamosain]|uniref:Uncharacterized protein n=1 Tax=Scylla paramamosain TaxID=85552 RepID=A0AAW0TA17_SCYPA
MWTSFTLLQLHGTEAVNLGRPGTELVEMRRSLLIVMVMGGLLCSEVDFRRQKKEATLHYGDSFQGIEKHAKEKREKKEEEHRWDEDLKHHWSVTLVAESLSGTEYLLLPPRGPVQKEEEEEEGSNGRG